MREIALHLLDIAENSVAAQANIITLSVKLDLAADLLQAKVQDDGRGMDEATIARVIDPFYTTRTTRKVGLGIPLLKAAAEACNGYLTIQSAPGKGACIEVAFQNSHIDRMPLGDLSSTFLTLMVAYPRIRWIFEYSCQAENNEVEIFVLDTQEIIAALGDIPFCEPTVLNYLRNFLDEGIAQVAQFARITQGLLEV